MKASLVKLIFVVAVRDHGMVAVLGGLSIMQVPRVVRASMVRRTPIRVPLADLDAMGHDDVALLMFEAVFVHVVDVIAVANGRMPASRSVSICHDRLPSYLCAHNNERKITRFNAHRGALRDLFRCLAHQADKLAWGLLHAFRAAGIRGPEERAGPMADVEDISGLSLAGRWRKFGIGSEISPIKPAIPRLLA